MSAPISEIVDHVIRHARKMSTSVGYDRETARAALGRLLADLERRDPDDPALERLRAFIAEGDPRKPPNAPAEPQGRP